MCAAFQGPQGSVGVQECIYVLMGEQRLLSFAVIELGSALVDVLHMELH